MGILAAVWVVTTIAAHPLAATLIGITVAGTGAVAISVRVKQRRATQALGPAQQFRIADYQAMSAKEFEHTLADLCRRDGCTQIKVVGGAGDLGADVIARTPTGKRIVIQAKRYAPTTKVGSPDVQKVGGTARQIHGADIAAVVTTSTFTPAARDYAKRVGIHLIDGNGLARWASHASAAPWN